MASPLDALVDDIDHDLALRKRELADLHLLAQTSTAPRRDTLARACLVLAYAHWEGFTKFALLKYCEFLERLNIVVADVVDSLQILQLTPSLRTAAAEKYSIDARVSLFQELEARSTTVFSVSNPESLALGNLDSKTLKATLEAFALEYRDAYRLRANFIDASICARRHRIAHGVIEPVDLTDLADVMGFVVDATEMIAEQITETALYERFRHV